MRFLIGVTACCLSFAACASDATDVDDGLSDGKADLCSADDTEEAKCVAETEPGIYDTSRAVLRLTIGAGTCTGWLVGDDGHVLTNRHCVRFQNTANTIVFESMAEGKGCDQDCSDKLACPGNILGTGATLVKNSYDFDYSLLKLPAPAPAELGYLRLRRTGAKTGERIYVPQHPLGGGKRIAVHAEGELATVLGTTEDVPQQTPCGGTGPRIRYRADTQPGSSGSPVIAYSDNAVVALHHCNGCERDGGNRGVPIQDVIADLGDLLPASAFTE
ncbi:MAG: serine protease [Kofleriaceae bacterium]